MLNMPNSNSKLVLFLGRKNGSFTDNVKYAFLEAVQGAYNFTSLFGGQKARICQELTNAGLPAVYLEPKNTPALPLKPALVVCDDYWWKNNAPLAKYLEGVPVLQLWHGIPLKKIGLAEAASSINMNRAKANRLRHLYFGYTAIISTSAFVSEQIFPQVFGPANYINCGYPRNDVLFKPLANKFELLNTNTAIYGKLRAHKRAGGKIAAFMPTFRDQGGSSLEHGKLNPASLQSFAQAHNLLLVFKFHPNEHTQLPKNLPNLIEYNAEADFYPCLALADLLITDYSSVYFDWLLLDRPLLFHVPDLEQYQAESREFLLEFKNWTPGQKSFKQEELLQNITTCLADPNQAHIMQSYAGGNAKGDAGSNALNYTPERQKIANLLFQFKDAHSARRVCEYIDNLLANKI